MSAADKTALWAMVTGFAFALLVTLAGGIWWGFLGCVPVALTWHAAALSSQRTTGGDSR